MVFFNSYIGKEFVEKYSRQGLQTNLNLSEVGDLSIPIIYLATQTQIAALVQESFTLKAESERLLDMAKRAVEIAIETDERAAMVYLESQT
jgi:restriction endonuclease S subunit